MNKLLAANVLLLAALLVLGVILAPAIMKELISFLPSNLTLIALNPQDGLMAMFVIGILLSLFIYIPIGIVSLYLYIKPALYDNEIKFANNTVLLALGLFTTGTIFGLFSFIYLGVPFFLWTNQLIGIANYWSAYSFVTQLLLASLCVGISFLFPVILNNAINFDFIKIESLKKNRKWFIIGLAIIVIIVPWMPNNPLQQLIIALPLIGMYEAVIFAHRDKEIAKEIVGVPSVQ